MSLTPDDELRLFGRVDYPFPLSDGSVAHLSIPGGHLEADDAERLAEFLLSLVAQGEKP